MMFSVTDIMGLNPFMRKILANAAGAACGMAEVDVPIEAQETTARRRHHRRHHHRRGDEGDRGAGGRRLRDDRLPRGRHRRPRDGRDDDSRASSGRCSTSQPSKSRTRCTTPCWPAGPERLTTAGRLGLAPGDLSGRDRGAGLPTSRDTVPPPYQRPHPGPAQPADHRRAAEQREMVEVGREVGERLQSTAATTVSS